MKYKLDVNSILWKGGGCGGGCGLVVVRRLVLCPTHTRISVPLGKETCH